jgi:hypothetical protein
MNYDYVTNNITIARPKTNFKNIPNIEIRNSHTGKRSQYNN